MLIAAQKSTTQHPRFSGCWLSHTLPDGTQTTALVPKVYVLALDGGDVNISAQSVDIIAATDTADSSSASQTKQSGLTIAISNPIIDALQTGFNLAQAASKSSNGRTQALAIGSAALTALNTYNAVQSHTGADGQSHSSLTNVTVSATYGTSKSSSTSNQHASQSVGSTIQAGGNVNISATGAGQNSNIAIIGSDINAGHSTNLTADNQLNILSADNAIDQSPTTKAAASPQGSAPHSAAAASALAALSQAAQAKATATDKTSATATATSTANRSTSAQAATPPYAAPSSTPTASQATSAATSASKANKTPAPTPPKTKTSAPASPQAQASQAAPATTAVKSTTTTPASKNKLGYSQETAATNSPSKDTPASQAAPSPPAKAP